MSDNQIGTYPLNIKIVSGGYEILSMVGKIKADWLSACADVAYLLIWPTIMRFIWQIDKDE